RLQTSLKLPQKKHPMSDPKVGHPSAIKPSTKALACSKLLNSGSPKCSLLAIRQNPAVQSLTSSSIWMMDHACPRKEMLASISGEQVIFTRVFSRFVESFSQVSRSHSIGTPPSERVKYRSLAWEDSAIKRTKAQ